MIKKTGYILFIFTLWAQILQAQNETDVISYIDKYKNFAIEEQLRSGIPAAITLAQGIFESAAGKSELASQANNHFGIKCKNDWTGETMLHDDDRKKECFRKYSNSQQSYIDHSDFLRAGSRYQFLFDIEITDYVSWATGLKKAGYATNPLYVKKLTDLVERYNLQQYTYDALGRAAKKTGEAIPNVDNRNPDIVEDPSSNYKGLRGFWAKQGEMISDKANQYNIRPGRLLEYNDLNDVPLPSDMFIFTERKKKMGTVEFHTVKEGETMHLVSQKEAMQLENLYRFNNITPGDEPETGEQLSLQYRSYGTPRLKGKAPVPVIEEKIVQVEPVKETKTEPEVAVKKEQPANGILDAEKAKKIEEILGNPDDKTGNNQEAKVEKSNPVPVPSPKKEEPRIAEVKKEEPKKEEPKKEVISANADPVKEEPKKEDPKPEKKRHYDMPKRYYNEPGVSDSVKKLKEKFDMLVYRPLPERKAEVVKPVANAAEPRNEIRKTSTGVIKDSVIKKTDKPVAKKDTVAKKATNAKKPEAKKTDAAKKPAAANKDTEKPKAAEPKSDAVEKTKTGIVRDVKKLEDEKKKQKEEQAKKEALNAKTSKAKVTAKKDDPKKKGKPEKEAAKKDDKKAEAKGKKTSDAKKDKPTTVKKVKK